MTSHELAQQLLEKPDRPVELSIADPNDTAFTRSEITVKDRDDHVQILGWVSSDADDAHAPWSHTIDAVNGVGGIATVGSPTHSQESQVNCKHPDHVDGQSCEDRAVGCNKDCECCCPSGSVSFSNEELVHVVVTEKPQKVWVVFRNKIHYGAWGTVNPGECGVRSADAGSNRSLLNAAMYAWDGTSHFSLPYNELVERSGGWGIQWD